MTQKEKQELWIAICGYLPHGVIFDYNERIVYGFDWLNIRNQILTITNQFSTPIEEVRPYLRPMSSMTEEEKTKLSILIGGFPSEEDIYIVYTNIPYKNFAKVIDWLNEHHFDYRGLIEKGLALEAPEDMYNTKTE